MQSKGRAGRPADELAIGSEMKRKIKNDFYESEQLFCDQKPGLL